MTSLGELREALDKIDNEIAELYEKRMEVCRKVGEYKVKSGKKVFDRQREKEKLADVMSKVEGDFNKKGIQELYQQLKPDYPDLSLGTVYRNLSLFSKQGDVMSVGVFRGQERFDARTEPHAHLHCAQCGRVIDVPLPGAPEPQLCALAQSVTDAQVLGCSITFTGLCKACQQAAKEAASK